MRAHRFATLTALSDGPGNSQLDPILDYMEHQASHALPSCLSCPSDPLPFCLSYLSVKLSECQMMYAHSVLP